MKLSRMVVTANAVCDSNRTGTDAQAKNLEIELVLVKVMGSGF